MEQIDEQQKGLHATIDQLRADQKELRVRLNNVSRGQGKRYTKDYNREAVDDLDRRGMHAVPCP